MADHVSDAFGRRLSRAIVVLALAGVAYYTTLGGAYTLLDIRDLEHRLEEQSAVVAELTDEWQRIQSRGDSLESDPWAIERVARERYSFIRPGETLFRFIDLGEPPADTDPSED